MGREPKEDAWPPVFELGDIETVLRVKRRWWLRPICWIRRHRRDGEPLILSYVSSDGQPTCAIFERVCQRCGKSEYVVGVDAA